MRAVLFLLLIFLSLATQKKDDALSFEGKINVGRSGPTLRVSVRANHLKKPIRLCRVSAKKAKYYHGMTVIIKGYIKTKRKRSCLIVTNMNVLRSIRDKDVVYGTLKKDEQYWSLQSNDGKRYQIKFLPNALNSSLPTQIILDLSDPIIKDGITSYRVMGYAPVPDFKDKNKVKVEVNNEDSIEKE